MIPQTLVHDEGEVFTRWIKQADLYGVDAKAAAFSPDFKGCDRYLRLAEQMMPPRTIRERSQGSFARWTLPNKATFVLDRIPNMYHAYTNAGKDFSLMAYQDPADWPDQGPLEYMLMLLRSAVGVPTEFITVHSPFVSELVLPPTDSPSATSTIDYFAITKAVAG